MVPLGARSHHYLLLTLARMRLKDVERGEPAATAGWVDQEELGRLLQFSPERLNLDIFRARRQFGAVHWIRQEAFHWRLPCPAWWRC